MNDAADARPSLYRALSTHVSPGPELGNGETIVTEQVETVDGDRSIDMLLTSSLIG
jgi:hypothetical protein